MHVFPRLTAVVGFAVVAACGGGSDVEFSNTQLALGPGDIRITSQNGGVDLMLVGDKIVAGLSDSVLAEIGSETDTSDVESDSELGAKIEKFVKSTVKNVLNHRFEYQLRDLEDASYQNGRIVFEYSGGDKFEMLENAEIDNEPILASFSDEDSERFVAAVRARLAGESEPEQASAATSS